jgi:hypothetical protein
MTFKHPRVVRQKMKLIWKIVIALAVVLLSPALMTFVLFQTWRDVDDFVTDMIPAVFYLLPILLLSLGVRLAFRTTKVAIGIYVAGMGLAFAGALSTLGGELHAPAVGYIYIPAIAISFPFGWRAIVDETIRKPNKPNQSVQPTPGSVTPRAIE